MNDPLLKQTQEIVQAPEFIAPWLDRFYEPAEMQLMQRFSPCSRKAVTLVADRDMTGEKLSRLLRRGVLSETQKGGIEPANFHTRYDIWANFEGFKDVPDKIRDRLNRWELDAYIRSRRKDVEEIRQTGQMDPAKIIPRYLLLEEACEVLDQVKQVFLWPCNCRSMIRACKKPVYTCLRFDNSQGQGYEISREKAKEIVHMSNRKGLMQSGELGRDRGGRLVGAICNCCPDCCFPHLLARELNAEKLWPVSCHVAEWHKEDCSACGLCAKRCPFDAFRYDSSLELKQDRVAFAADRCRGCGLCAVTCPEHAIQMRKMTE